ncbi:hypothetical protein PR048_008041 [Dryococelus australis]|uniref:Uncharacterized protein n=1 Tax=Dryococelus australis TaxID=614101 RepID=A0ABQ9HWV5_9NEOP|nr:hypothetical protein PR048_008041 [Dryococelus australis]
MYKPDFLVMIIGCDFIQKHRLIPDLHACIATLRHNHDQIITREQNNFLLNCIQKIQNLEPDKQVLPFANINPILTIEQKNKVKEIISN